MTELFVYITVGTMHDAQTIAESLVQKRLAACVNLLPSMESVYRWQGKIERDAEVVLIAKTTNERFDALAVETRRLHPYACPCVVGMPITHGTADYLTWIRDQTSLTPEDEPA